MSRGLIDIAINTSTLELYIDGVRLQPVRDELGDETALRSQVWTLYHYLTDIRDELAEWREYYVKLQSWLGHEPHEPPRADRRGSK